MEACRVTRRKTVTLKEDSIPDGAIRGFFRFNSPHYRPQHHPVSFDADIRKVKKGKFIGITRIGPSDVRYSYQGILICSGNMLEASGEEAASPRKRHALVLVTDAILIEGQKVS
jgi:hypothetical protein